MKTTTKTKTIVKKPAPKPAAKPKSKPAAKPKEAKEPAPFSYHVAVIEAERTQRVFQLAVLASRLVPRYVAGTDTSERLNQLDYAVKEAALLVELARNHDAKPPEQEAPKPAEPATPPPAS